MAIEPQGIVPWGRSFDEYVRMFALSEADLGRGILDCAAGPSSFTAEMHRGGNRAIASDPIYALQPRAIRARVAIVRDRMMRLVRHHPEDFVWSRIRSPDHLEEIRMGSMETFLADFEADSDRNRYVAQSLPDLRFRDREFGLALCSHFLFLYSGELNEEFHIAAVRELLRVAGEVRIFPVTDLSGKPSSHLTRVQAKFDAERVRVPYEFLRGANEMLVVRQTR
jgi:hypothetical protein